MQIIYCLRQIRSLWSLRILALQGKNQWLRWWLQKLGLTVGWLLRFVFSGPYDLHNFIVQMRFSTFFLKQKNKWVLERHCCVFYLAFLFVDTWTCVLLVWTSWLFCLVNEDFFHEPERVLEVFLFYFFIGDIYYVKLLKFFSMF